MSVFKPKDLPYLTEHGLKAAGFFAYANQFYEASTYMVLQREFSVVRYYLLCRALELIMKSYLISRGTRISDLKKRSLGHDLDALLALAKQKGVEEYVKIEIADIHEINKATLVYKAKAFEYFDLAHLFTTKDQLPNLATLSTLVSRLLRKLEGHLY